MDINHFFRKIFSRPVLLWKFSAAILFILLGGYMFFVPPYGFEGNPGMRNTFSALLVLYGCFRFYTFYNDYKREEQ